MILTTSCGEPITLKDVPALLGGEASVYQAEDRSGRRLAVKVSLLPLPQGAWLDEERHRLEDVARDAVAGAHVIQVRHHGCWGDRPFLTMDWCADTLATYVPRATAPARLRVAIAVCRAVQALHEARPGLVHRDLKPTNVLLDGDVVRLADFGTARDHRPGQTTTTAIHTPGWSPPEQALPLRQRPERSWDVYALAATVFFTLVGSAPEGPGANARRLTADGARLLAGLIPDAEGPTDRWLDLARAPALTRLDLTRLRATGASRAVERALCAALAPRARDRRGTAGSLADALEAPRRFALAGPITGSVAVTALAAAVVATWRPPTTTEVAVVPVAASADLPAYELGSTEVSQGLWRSVVGEDPSQHRSRTSGSVGQRCSVYEGVPLVGEALPVVCVDFFEALAFANALSRRDGLRPAYLVRDPEGVGLPEVAWDRGADGWRLPTDAEWAHAAAADRALPRGEGDTACAFGNVGDQRTGVAFARFPVFRPFACDDGFAGLAPIDALPHNPWGLAGLFGNVTEWVWAEPRETVQRPARGAAWTDDGSALDLGRPSWYRADDRMIARGFRLARSAR